MIREEEQKRKEKCRSIKLALVPLAEISHLTKPGIQVEGRAQFQVS